MSKSILVMDTPRVCLDCRFCRKLRADACCEISDDPEDPECLRLIGDDYSKRKPDWCPLEEYREKKNDIEELLPCPFCGEKAKLHSTKGFNGKIVFAFVGCNHCESSTKRYSTEAGAIGAWNKRT